MLPSELLRTRINRGRITPLFCTATSGSGTDYDLASRLVALFTDTQKDRQRKGDLLQKIGSLESEHDYKLVSGAVCAVGTALHFWEIKHIIIIICCNAHARKTETL